MLQCLEPFKHLFALLLRCCDIDLYKQSKGLEDPERLARETECMSIITFKLALGIYHRGGCMLAYPAIIFIKCE